MTTALPSRSVSRPRWQTTGGGTFLAAAALLAVATLFEYPLLNDPSSRTVIFWIFVVLFAGSAILFLIASSALAFGSTGSNGIIGRSVLGKVGLLGFGVFWLLAQGIYLLWAYFLTAPDSSAFETLTTVLTILMFASATLAGVMVAVKHIATGIARWSILIGLVISAIASTAARSTSSAELLTVLYVVSALVLAFVGVTYLRARVRD